MKRKITLGLVMLLIGLQLIGCGNKTEENTNEETSSATESYEAIYFKDIEIRDKVVLGDYKNLEVVSNVTAITDEDVDNYIDYMLSMSPELVEVTDRDVVENGDVANIDYVGKKDGVAFDGGTAQGYDLGIGTGAFIPGFEEGLVGAKVGETTDLNLTFPENYGSPELDGSDVVFTVTVNKISKKVTPEFTDEYVAGLEIENVSTVEEYRVYLKNMMEDAEEEYALQDVQTQIITMVTENATVTEVPQELIDRFYNVNKNNMSYNAMMYGMDLESFVSAYYGMDAETFEKETIAAAEISAKQALVCLAIAENENLTLTEEDVEKAIDENYASYGYADADTFKKSIDLEEYKDSLLLNKVLDFLVENATITEVPEITE